MAEPRPAVAGRRRRDAPRARTGLAAAVGGRASGHRRAARGCATLPPAAPIPDIAAIVGPWRGNIQFGHGPYEILYVTISPDGGLVASWGITTRWGKVTVANGRARFEPYLWSGDLQYLVGPGERIIVYAQATPLS